MSRDLDYSRRPTPADRRRAVRLLFGLVAVKLVLVVVNTLLAFEAFGPVPDVVRFAGIGLQVALTVVFLIALLRLSVR